MDFPKRGDITKGFQFYEIEDTNIHAVARLLRLYNFISNPPKVSGSKILTINLQWEQTYKQSQS